MTKKRKPPNFQYVQFTTTKGKRIFKRFSPEKYEWEKENLPDGWTINKLEKKHWEDRRKHFRKKLWPSFLSWVRKYDAELSILILLLILIVAVIALFIKD